MKEIEQQNIFCSLAFQSTSVAMLPMKDTSTTASDPADQTITKVLKHNLLTKPYKYRLRPGYGSDKLLLEFYLANKESEFQKDLFKTLKDLNPKIDTVEDLWMNDEVLLEVSSENGKFTLSRDIWDFAFIMADNNQPCIKLIDEILKSSNLFKKEEVNFEDYKNGKN